MLHSSWWKDFFSSAPHRANILEMDSNFVLGKLIDLDNSSEAIDLSAFPLVEQNPEALSVEYSELLELNGHLQELGNESCHSVDDQVSFKQKNILQDLVSNLFGPTSFQTDENILSYTEPQLTEEQVACLSTDSVPQQSIGYCESTSTYNEGLGAPYHVGEPCVMVNASDNEEIGTSFTEDPNLKIVIVNDREVHVEVNFSSCFYFTLM